MARDVGRATRAGQERVRGDEPAAEPPASMSATRRLVEDAVGAEPILLAGGNAAAGRLVRRRAAGDPAVTEPGGVEAGLAARRGGGGVGIPEPVRGELESGTGASLAGVRVHTGGEAASFAAGLGARAFTVGSDIYFGRGEFDPGSAGGYHLLAHEVAHTLQPASTDGVDHARGSLLVGSVDAPAERQADRVADQLAGHRGEPGAVLVGRGGGSPVVRRQIKPEDVSGEMVGRSMRTTGAVPRPGGGEVAAGATVVVVGWVNTSETVRVRFAGPPGFEADVSKTLLEPVAPSVPGVAPYSAGVAGQAASVERGEAALAAERARPGGPRPGEVPRMEGLQQVREAALNRVLIQETMYNRFDPVIKQWTDHYNTELGYRGADALDPDLVKAMLFQETQMGTAGQHMVDPVPAGPEMVKSRFNVGQVIDTSCPALLIMMTEMQPGLIAAHQLGNIRRDMIVAQRRHRDLTDKSGRTPAEEAELANLNELAKPGASWETYMLNYRAAGAATGFWEAVLAFFAAPAGGVSRNLDYEFWIRTAIRWLFEKRRNVGSWPEAVRAYNGSGPAARNYRDAVVGRAGAADAADQAGKPYVPKR